MDEFWEFCGNFVRWLAANIALRIFIILMIFAIGGGVAVLAKVF